MSSRGLLGGLPAGGAALAMRAASATPIAGGWRSGTELEKTMRQAANGYQAWLFRTLGYASHRDVERLRELIRSLEYRIENLEQSTATKP